MVAEGSRPGAGCPPGSRRGPVGAPRVPLGRSLPPVLLQLLRTGPEAPRGAAHWGAGCWRAGPIRYCSVLLVKLLIFASFSSQVLKTMLHTIRQVQSGQPPALQIFMEAGRGAGRGATLHAESWRSGCGQRDSGPCSGLAACAELCTPACSTGAPRDFQHLGDGRVFLICQKGTTNQGVVTIHRCAVLSRAHTSWRPNHTASARSSTSAGITGKKGESSSPLS